MPSAVDAASCASSTTIPVLRTHLISSSSSLLDATLLDVATRDVVYALITDPSTNTTMLTRPNAERVAYVQWTTSSLTQPTILFEGDTSPISANETMFSSSVLGHSRKFRSAGYAESFKWKKVTGGWQCFTSTRSLLASLQLSSRSGSSLEIYHHHSRPVSSSSSSSGSRKTSSEESLQDTLVLTSLLLTTPPYGSGPPPKRFSSSLPVTPTSKPMKKHSSMPRLRSKRSSSGLASPTSSFTSFSSACSKATSRSSRLSTQAPPSLSSYVSVNTLALPSPPPSPFLPTSPIPPTINAPSRCAFEIERETPPPSASIIPRSRRHSANHYYVQPLPNSEGYEEAYYPPLVVIPDDDLPEPASWNLEAKIRALEAGEKLRDTMPLAV